MTGACYFCGTKIEGPVYRSAVCPQCGRDVKICLNCAFYSPGSHWDCHETIPEPVKDKERANFCDYFRLGSNFKGAQSGPGSGEQRKAFENLFGD